MDTVLFGDGGCAVRSAGQHTNERVAIDVASIFADWRATFTFHVLQPSAPRLPFGATPPASKKIVSNFGCHEINFFVNSLQNS